MKIRHGSTHRSEDIARNANLQNVGHIIQDDMEDAVEAQFQSQASDREERDSPQVRNDHPVQSEQQDNDEEVDEQADDAEDGEIAEPTADDTNQDDEGSDEKSAAGMAIQVDNSQWPYGRKLASPEDRAGSE